MTSNILITGAAGYIGGSILADFLANHSAPVGREHIYAAVRSNEQAEVLSKLGVSVLQVDLTDEKSVVENILRYQINIIIHCASSLNPEIPINLITALGKLMEISGKEVSFIHSSGLSAFYEKTGWPQGETQDTDDIFAIEKQLADSFDIRQTDVAVIKHAKARGVTSFVVIPSTVYGEGSGEWNRLSVVLPRFVQASLLRKKVYKFAENTKMSAVHITDLTALYWRLTEAILQKEPIPHGEEGYYFAIAHHLDQWDVLDHLAEALEARGLVAGTTLEVWPDNEFAAESLGVPAQFVTALWNAGDNIVATRAQSIGWKPQWTERRFLENINDEINAVVDHGKAKSSLIDSLFVAVRRGISDVFPMEEIKWLKFVDEPSGLVGYCWGGATG